MAEEVNAGAILIEIKAQVEGIKKGFTEVKQVVESFGKGIQTTAAGVQQAGTQMSQSFDRMEKSQARLAARTALMVSRLLSLQIIIQQIGTRFAGSRFSKEIQVMTDALTSFGAIVSVFPTKLGLIAGGLAALATVIANLRGPTEAQRKEMEKIRDLIDELGKERDAISKSGERSTSGFNLINELGLSNDALDAGEKQNRELEYLIDQRDLLLRRALKNQEAIDARREKIKQQGGGTVAGEFELLGISSLEKEIRDDKDAIQKLQADISSRQITKAIQDIRGEVVSLGKETATAAKNLDLFFRHGLIDPLDKLRGEVALAEKELTGLLDLQAKLEAIRPGAGGELGTSIAAAIQKTQAARNQANRGMEVDRMAANFSNAIGEGIVDGILSGASAMETLANVGRNLFENFLRDTVNQFKTWMTDAFKAITGVAGVEIGGLITGIMGVVGMFLSQRGKKGSDAFSAVKSNIESSQAVRGVVAGPVSVGIAAVGENISRAVAPLIEVAREQLAQLKQMNGKLGSVSAGGGYAGRVATT